MPFTWIIMPVHFVMWSCLGTHLWYLVFAENLSLVKTHTAYGGWVGRRGKSCSLPTEIKFLCVFLVKRVIMKFGTSWFHIGYNSTLLLSNTPSFQHYHWQLYFTIGRLHNTRYWVLRVMKIIRALFLYYAVVDRSSQFHIIIIFTNCSWVVTRWQWLFYMYTKCEIGYY